MSLAAAADVEPFGAHHTCLDTAIPGWAVCLTASEPGLAIRVSSPERTRIVVVEPSNRTRPPSLEHQTRLAAARLLDAEMSPPESVDALCLLLSRQLGRRAPGPSIVLLDLTASGLVEIAGRIAPPALFLPSNRPAQAYPLSPGVGHAIRVEPGEHLAIFSSAFVELTPARVLNGLARYARHWTDPCELRDQLARTFCDEQGGPYAGLTPPAALVMRSLPTDQ